MNIFVKRLIAVLIYGAGGFWLFSVSTSNLITTISLLLVTSGLAWLLKLEENKNEKSEVEVIDEVSDDLESSLPKNLDISLEDSQVIISDDEKKVEEVIKQ